MGKYVEALIEGYVKYQKDKDLSNAREVLFYVRVPSIHGAHSGHIQLYNLRGIDGPRLPYYYLPKARVVDEEIFNKILELMSLPTDISTSGAFNNTPVAITNQNRLPVVYVEFLNNDYSDPVIVGCTGKFYTGSMSSVSSGSTNYTYNSSSGVINANYSSSALDGATNKIWYWPVADAGVKASLERPYSSRGFSGDHHGVDIIYNGDSHPTIYAAAAGTVVEIFTGCINNNSLDSSLHLLHDCKTMGCHPVNAQGQVQDWFPYRGGSFCNGAYGNVIWIDHGDGYRSCYAHLHPNTVSVTVGQSVTAGTALAKMGSTGGSSGNHLHFEIRKNGTAINNNPGNINYNILVQGQTPSGGRTGALLAQVAEQFSNYSTCYLKGFWGQYLTRAEYDRILAMYPSNAKFGNENKIGTSVYPFDCICFVKALMGGATPTNRINYSKMAATPIGDCDNPKFYNMLTDINAPLAPGMGIASLQHAGLVLDSNHWIDCSYGGGQNGLMIHTGNPRNYSQFRVGKIPGVTY